MIGDWVMPLKKKLKGIPGRVVTIDGGTNVCWIDNKDYSCLVPCSDVERIPITPEILEKNFENREVRILAGTKTHYCLVNDYFALAVSEYTDSTWEVEYTNCEAHFPLIRNLVGYVHELQHALRLCGIEKEIVL